MGVYIFQSNHGPWIKIGHHKVTQTRPSVYYRIARRGFHSCVHPRDLRDHLDEQDFGDRELVPDARATRRKRCAHKSLLAFDWRVPSAVGHGAREKVLGQQGTGVQRWRRRPNPRAAMGR